MYEALKQTQNKLFWFCFGFVLGLFSICFGIVLRCFVSVVRAALSANWDFFGRKFARTVYKIKK